MPTAPRPGWYRDPAGSDDFRWWDGEFWSEAISATADAPRPGIPQSPVESSGDVASAPVVPPAGAGRTARPAPSAVKVLLIVTCVAVVAAAGLGVGQYWWRDSSPGTPTTGPTNSSAPVAPGARTAPQPPSGQLDESSRVATIGAASMTLPGEPYELYDDPLSITGAFDIVFAADADVHPDYDGKHSWSATVMLVHLSPALTSSSDLGHAGTAAIRQLSRHMFGGHPTAVRGLTSTEHAVDGHPGVMYGAEARYTIARLPSRYDQVTALVVRLDDGSVVAAISSVPNDASAETKRLARTAVSSLHVR